MNKPIASPETLRNILRYEPDTGKLFWRARAPDMFSDGEKYTADRICRAWNGRCAGKLAFTSLCKGYPSTDIGHKFYMAHRVIWAIETGAWPCADIDHINGIRNDNRLINLRAVSRTQNCMNRGMASNNTSGVVGVHWNKNSSKWQAYIRAEGRRYHLGFFADKAAAISVRKAAEVEHGFHPNHGR